MGIDPQFVLEASGADAAIVSALLQKVVEITEQRDDAMAVRIANAVGRLFGGKG